MTNVLSWASRVFVSSKPLITNVVGSSRFIHWAPINLFLRSTAPTSGVMPAGAVGQTSFLQASGDVQLTCIRTKVRNYFPRPREVKRVRMHGWVTRMKKFGGQNILRRRILKGRHVLSH